MHQKTYAPEPLGALNVADDYAPAPSGRRWAPSPRTRRRLSRGGGPVLYFLLIGLVLMVPFHPRHMLHTPAEDLGAHVGSIAAAAEALRLGMFPLRVAPREHRWAQFPVFNFYGNVPYLAGGALTCLGVGIKPYLAYRLVLLMTYVIGGWYAYRTSLWLTRRPWVSLVAGTAFAAAPYMFVDVHARAAFPEAVSMGLMAPALFYTLRCFSRRRLGDVLACGVAWCAVCLSHNLTVLYGGLFVCVLLLLTAAPRWSYVRRVARVAAGCGLGIVLSLWYLVPAARIVPDLWITASETDPPLGAELLTPLHVLLWPVARTPIGSTTANLDLQVGLLILLGAAGTTLALLTGARPARGRRLAVALLLTFGLCFVAAWSPVRDAWNHLPPIAGAVQFTYRFLVYTTLFGVPLLAIALARVPLVPRRWQAVRGRAGVAAGLLLVTAAGVATQTYPSYRERWVAASERAIVKEPSVGGNAGTAYLLRAEVTNASTINHPDINFAELQYGVRRPTPLYPRPDAMVLPAPPPGSTLEVNGVVPADFPPATVVTAVVGDETFASAPAAPGGTFLIAAPLRPAAGKTVDVRIELTLPAPPDPRAAAALRELAIHGLFFRAPAGATVEPFIALDDARATARFGKRTRWTRELKEPTLVQLPILYYPGNTIELTDNGRPVTDYGNVGKYVALRLDAGPHFLRGRYRGTPWADAVIGESWALVLVVGVALSVDLGRGTAAVRQQHDGRSCRPTTPDLAAGRGGGGGVRRGGPVARPARPPGAPQQPDAVLLGRGRPRVQHPARKPLAAFDGDLTTAWSIDATRPTTLTLTDGQHPGGRRTHAAGRRSSSSGTASASTSTADATRRRAATFTCRRRVRRGRTSLPPCGPTHRHAFSDPVPVRATAACVSPEQATCSYQEINTQGDA